MPVRRQTFSAQPTWLSQPSWWVVVVAGALVTFFLVAIVRELMQGYRVRQQVARLRQQVASAERHQAQLRDLLDYLASPTFQERQARLNLGLKKTGERVIIVPSTNGNINSVAAVTPQTANGASSMPARWWQYFFGPRLTSTSPS